MVAVFSDEALVKVIIELSLLAVAGHRYLTEKKEGFAYI